MSTTVCQGKCPSDHRMVSCAVSGGTLEQYIKTCMDKSGGRLCLKISPQYMAFSLPCPGGNGKSLTPTELRQLYHGQKVHYSEALKMEYFTYLDQGVLQVVLFDSERSLREKFQLAKALNVPFVYIPEPFLRSTLLVPRKNAPQKMRGV